MGLHRLELFQYAFERRDFCNFILPFAQGVGDDFPDLLVVFHD
jgi:hypothetical protein